MTTGKRVQLRRDGMSIAKCCGCSFRAPTISLDCDVMVHGAGACDGALIMVPGRCIVLAHVLVHRAGASCWCMVLVHWCIVLMLVPVGTPPSAHPLSAYCQFCRFCSRSGSEHRTDGGDTKCGPLVSSEGPRGRYCQFCQFALKALCVFGAVNAHPFGRTSIFGQALPLERAAFPDQTPRSRRLTVHDKASCKSSSCSLRTRKF